MHKVAPEGQRKLIQMKVVDEGRGRSEVSHVFPFLYHFDIFVVVQSLSCV